MGELDRITRAFGCHASSMPSLALSATSGFLKLTHYQPVGVIINISSMRSDIRAIAAVCCFIGSIGAQPLPKSWVGE